MNRRLGVQIISIITALLFLSIIIPNTVQSIPPITQDTIIVDITGNGDYTSIQEAINNAKPTDVIQIRNGIYNEHDITVGKKIEIIGEDPNDTIINASGNVGFTLTSSFVDISNLQIINAFEYGIIIDFGSEGCTISNCIIDTKLRTVAIEVRSAFNTITDCNLIGFDTSKQGVKLQGSYNVIKNSYMQDFANGVLVIRSANFNQIQNCNMINNENGIDIRLNSHDNIVSGCNVYSNLQSIKIWQNSNNNLVYLNNFWKNDIDAIDDSNNTWDNGEQGNYWDRYQGRDNNGDGIGDIPYTISEGNDDRYPMISLILPDILIPPTNLIQTSGKSDDTPSFSWNPSVYAKGIKGYYVRIDNNPEIFIGDVTSWTSTEPVLDGVHKFYVRAESTDDKISNYSSITFSIDLTLQDADEDGWSDQEEQQFGTDPYDPNNYPLDTDNDHIPDSIDSDDDNDGYDDDLENSYGTDSINLNDYPIDLDRDGIPNDDSNDGKYLGDEDDDNDGLTDTVEASLGSNSLNASDVAKIFISGKIYYLVDGSGNGFFDILYEPISASITGVEKRDGEYLIDENGDGTWDHTYSVSDGSVSTYEDQTITLIIWILLIIGSIFAAIYIVPKYLKRKPLKLDIFRRPERVIKRPSLERAIRLPISEKKDTVTMITQTKTLLQHIQEDVEIYMDKLREIEQQFSELPEEKEEEIEEEPQELEPEESEDIREIEARVDKLLSKLDDKDKNKEDI